MAAVILVASMVPVSAELETVHLSSDQALLELLTDTLLISEGRIGDGLGVATFELDLGPHTNNPAATAQYEWPNGTAVPFTLTYDHIANVVSFIVDSHTLVYSPLPGFSDIFIRVRAVNDSTGMVVDNLVLEGEDVNDLSSTSGPDGLDILWIMGGNSATDSR